MYSKVMGMKLVLIGIIGLALTVVWFATAGPIPGTTQLQDSARNNPMHKSEQEWKKELPSDEFCVLRQKGTERAFSGKFWNHHEPGTYFCAGCGAKLFRSDTKYNSGSGWPSFWAPADSSNLHFERDTTMGMVRTEVTCACCGGHLGHLFDDGPQPTGQRYCINSAAMRFVKDSVPEKKDTAAP